MIEAREGRGADALFVGRKPDFSAADVAGACGCVWSGAKFFAIGYDNVLPSKDGDLPGSGTVVKAIEFATDTTATILGKPSRALSLAAEQRFGVAPESILIVGDQVDTDIRLGKGAGWVTALVLTGATNAARANRLGPRLRARRGFARCRPFARVARGQKSLSAGERKAALRGVEGFIFDGDSGGLGPGAADILELLAQREIPVVFVTQDTERSEEAIATDLRARGLRLQADQIVTCGALIVSLLQGPSQKQPVCLIASERQRNLFAGRGVRVAAKDDAALAKIVLIARIGGFSSDELTAACAHRQRRREIPDERTRALLLGRRGPRSRPWRACARHRARHPQTCANAREALSGRWFAFRFAAAWRRGGRDRFRLRQWRPRHPDGSRRGLPQRIDPDGRRGAVRASELHHGFMESCRAAAALG